MNSKDIIEAFTYVAKEKNVEKTYLTSIIEEIFTSMIVKKYGEEYKVMGLAPYGEPKYVQIIYENLINLIFRFIYGC